MIVRVAIAIILWFLPTVLNAQDGARLALVIGNQAYSAKIGSLKNPHNDVTLIEASLKRLGFKLTVIKDASHKAMDSALKRYVTEVRRAGRNALSFFYYSGHGVANPETQINYLIPVDVTDVDDDKVWFESLQQNLIIDMLSKQAPNATHYVVFDACRNELNLTGTAAKALGTDKGFVPITDTAGLLIAYATAPRKTASDVGDNGGPYAKILAEELVKPGVEAVTMFRNVQLKVKQTIGQDPWLSFPSLPAVYLAGKETAEEIELALWNSVKSSQTAAEFSKYLMRYPDGQFAPLARALIAHFEQQARAEQARIREKQRQEEEARRTAELHRIDEGQRARELEVTAPQHDAENKASTDAVLELEKQREADALIYAERMRKALENLRLAKETTSTAEAQRAAAAAEATEVAKAEITAKQAHGSEGERIVIASLPKLEKVPEAVRYDGAWLITWRKEKGMCPRVPENTNSYRIQIANGKIAARGHTGTISSAGTARWTVPSRFGDTVSYKGAFSRNSGSGTFYVSRTCAGRFSASRG